MKIKVDNCMDYEKMWEALKNRVEFEYSCWLEEAGSWSRTDLPDVLDWMKKFESGELPVE